MYVCIYLRNFAAQHSYLKVCYIILNTALSDILNIHSKTKSDSICSYSIIKLSTRICTPGKYVQPTC